MQNISRKVSQWWATIALAAALSFVAGITLGGIRSGSSIRMPILIEDSPRDISR